VDEFSIYDECAGARMRALLSKRAHSTRLLDYNRAREHEIEQLAIELQRAILSSPDLLSAVRRRLTDRGIELSEGEIEALCSTIALGPTVARDGRSRETPQLLGLSMIDAAPVPHRPEANNEAIWPVEATHMLKRAKCISFIWYKNSERTAVLLPGSVMRRKSGRSFPEYHRQLREEAVNAGYFVIDEEYLRVVSEYEVDTPSTAATLVVGTTTTNGWNLWRTREGNPIERPRTVRRGRRARNADHDDEHADPGEA
jgi:hypothetical protein